MDLNIPNQVARKFIEDLGAVLSYKTETHLHYKRRCVVVTLPRKSPVDYSHLEAIAIEQFNIPFWEFDYLLGQSGIGPNTVL